MNWQATGNILFGLGVFALVVGMLLSFRVGRWLLAGLLLVLSLISLLSGNFADYPNTNSDPMKAGRYWLLGGGIILLLGLVLRAFASKMI